MDDSILVVNCGSSSLKLALFDHDHQKITSALAERLNQSDAFARINGDETVPATARRWRRSSTHLKTGL